MKGWKPLKGMIFTIKDVKYIVSQNHWSISEEFEYMNKENGKKYISTLDKFNEAVVTGLIEL
tara:strand:+ start:183 stop:368 length:186 start_codon:yes stop_codon:yes gene_type:complete